MIVQYNNAGFYMIYVILCKILGGIIHAKLEKKIYAELFALLIKDQDYDHFLIFRVN